MSSSRQRAFDIYRELLAEAAGGEPTMALLRASFDRLVANFPVDERALFQEGSTGGVRSLRITIDGVPPERTVLYLHGGAYMTGNPEGVRDICSRLARAAKAQVIALDYRLAPESPFPAAVEDAVAGYRALLGEHGCTSLSIVGDSAGGGLTVATAVALRDREVDLPAVLVCFSPWIDLEATGSTYLTKAEADPIASKESLLMSAAAYLDGKDPTSPLAAPLHADLTGLPPMLIQVGSEEVLLDDSVRLARLAGEAGVNVRLEIQPGVPHVYQLFASFLPEAQAAIERSATFIATHSVAVT